MQAWWSELVTDGGAPPGRFAHAAAGAGETMYTVGGYAQGTCCQHVSVSTICWFAFCIQSYLRDHATAFM